MRAQAQENKSKVSFECTQDEKAYIKMLAAKEHVSISEYMLGKVRPDFPQERKPNAETLKAMKESREGKGIKCNSIEDFWDKMGMSPNA